MFHRHSINVDNIILPYGEVEKKKKGKLIKSLVKEKKKKRNNWFLPTKTRTAVHQCPKKENPSVKHLKLILPELVEMFGVQSIFRDG